jgi:VWFA-related protein
MRSIFIVLLALSITLSAQDAATPVFRTGVAMVRLDVGVSLDNVPIKDLAQQDFTVTDNDRPQTIASFGRESEPLALMLLLDISGSMRPYVQQISQTAQEAVRHLKPGDSIGIMAFGSRTALHFHFFDNHAEVVRQLQSVLTRQDEVGFGTAINQAIIDTARYMDKNTDPASQHAILILTDNLGTNYQANDHLAIGAVLAANAVLNAIVVGRGIRPGPPKPGSDRDYTPADVYKVAEDTGGVTIKAEDAGRAFDEMIARIRDRYGIGYNLPSDAKTGEFRHITVQLTPEARRRYPDATIRHRPGYFVR